MQCVAKRVKTCVSKKKQCVLWLIKCLEEVEEEEEYILKRFQKRKPIGEMYVCRDEGVYKTLRETHLLDDELKFKAYFRFTREQFNCILTRIEDKIACKSYNRVKKPITPAVKLALTLRFLATGESFRSLALAYRISPSYICTFVPQVLTVLKETLHPTFLPPPDQIDWQKKAEEFWSCWKFPNAIAALDGKHVRIVAPDHTGSLYVNYKGYFSIVFLAMVDANYKFLIVDIGSYGKEGDAGIFNKSEMRRLVQNGSIFPPPQYLPNSNILLPHVILCDEAFRLDKHIMKPYCRRQALEDMPKENFNYHLRKARRVSENAFGIMCSTFRVFFTPLNVKPETVDLIITVCCCLHNFLRDEYQLKHPYHLEETDRNELPTDNMIPLAGVGSYAKPEGFKVRSRFTDYFQEKQHTS